jgi:hypothetical protein
MVDRLTHRRRMPPRRRRPGRASGLQLRLAPRDRALPLGAPGVPPSTGGREEVGMREHAVEPYSARLPREEVHQLEMLIHTRAPSLARPAASRDAGASELPGHTCTAVGSKATPAPGAGVALLVDALRVALIVVVPVVVVRSHGRVYGLRVQVVNAVLPPRLRDPRAEHHRAPGGGRVLHPVRGIDRNARTLLEHRTGVRIGGPGRS